MDKKILVDIYKALVYPNLCYCNSVWVLSLACSSCGLYRRNDCCISGAEYGSVCELEMSQR